MSHRSGPQANTTESTERKPPTIADIVREKTDGGAHIIDFFIAVMDGAIEGAELCHRIDAAKQLVKFGSKDAAEFIAKYRGIPCGHSKSGPRDTDDPCPAEERTPVEVIMNAPAFLTREFLTVLSAMDEFLMRDLIRAQTADGSTIIDFLYDVMMGRETTFRTNHRIAAARELIAHILRDEQPSSVVPAEAGFLPQEPSPTQRGGGAPSNPANTDHTPSVVPTETETQKGGEDDPANVAESLPRPSSQLETRNQKRRTLPRKPRRLRRQLGDARARRRREATSGRSPPG